MVRCAEESKQSIKDEEKQDERFGSLL